MLNLELLQAVRDKILIEPEAHEQQTWMTVGVDVKPGDRVTCPTSACVAGWACQINGDIAIVSRKRAGDSTVEFPERHNHLGEYVAEEVITPDGRIQEIEDRAAELLGINPFGDDAEYDLFGYQHSREEVLDRLDRLIVRAKEENNRL